MKYFKFLTAGILFGIILTKSEVISWYRIYEMFRFESFHMYGVIGSAVLTGIIIIQLIKRVGLKSIGGEPVSFSDKAKNYKAALFGGTIFGLGWAMTGACPGPIYVLIGNGFLVFILVLISAALGTLAYGFLKPRLPH
ncbi:MAG: DUF6691 family protein [Bacteroidota bacterium]